MALTPASETATTRPDEWRLLSLLNAFRIGITGTLVVLYLANKLFAPLGSANPALFFKISLAYLLLSLVLGILIRKRLLPFRQQVYIGVIVDTLLITLLMHYSSGVESGLGVVLVVFIAANTIVVSQRIALGLAAFATIVVLMQQFYMGMEHHKQVSYPVAGLLGLTYLATAVLVNWLARRIRVSEALAEQRGIDLANLAQLTQHIIQRMQTGVIVVDVHGMIRLLNEAAAQLLGIKSTHMELPLQQVSPELAAQWTVWQQDSLHQPASITIHQLHITIQPRFARISEAAEVGSLIFLQDMSVMAQQAQQLQLASLGRLTASIAHEIRNPLGAISHAGQLLAESPQLDKNDQRLTQIIIDHTQRLNTIVENVMSVSRRRPSHSELFDLETFLQRFISEYTTGQNLDAALFRLEVTPADLQVRFDPGHLRQILVNLCDNALRHSTNSRATPCVTLRAGFDPDATRPHLDVIDSGRGVAADALPHLFEPFFTTAAKGTGLGLYLSRELAEANQAHLNYISRQAEPGIFRITFQDPRRQFE